MTQRLNISIPDDLYERVQNNKGRLNISQICQQAITHAIGIQELKDAAVGEIHNVVLRIKNEMERYGHEYEEDGLKDGIRDAYKMAYEDFWHIELYQDEWSPEELFDWAASKETKQKIDDDYNLHVVHAALDDLDYFREFYFRGWIKGVLDVWEKVKNELSKT